jgi:hypothetical protein
VNALFASIIPEIITLEQMTAIQVRQRSVGGFSPTSTY